MEPAIQSAAKNGSRTNQPPEPSLSEAPATAAGATHPVPSELGSAHARLLRAAAHVFAERGVHGASVEDILRAASIARRTFYRLYDNKQQLLYALYQFGTDSLLGACAVAISRGKTPLERVAGCIDAHLNNALTLGRLVFVLGGEAQRHDSPLHARRREVFDAIITMLSAALHDHPLPTRAPSEPMLRALLIALEGLTREALRDADEGREVQATQLAQVRETALHLARSALAL